MLKFIVLSDLHLVNADQNSRGLDTHDRLQKAIDAINARHGDADFCVLAGDLADLGFKGEEEPYHRLKALVSKLSMPYHITIGNHDSRALFLKVFGDEAKSPTGYLDKVVDHKGYRVILMDSVVAAAREHTHDGHLAHEQLDWLQARLDEVKGTPVIVVVHHHANPTYTVLDQLSMNNGEAFAKTLKSHGDVRQVIAGHVHFPSTGFWHGVPFTTIGGSHYGVGLQLDIEAELDLFWGPAQFGVVLADPDQTLVHFDSYLDSNAVLLPKT